VRRELSKWLSVSGLAEGGIERTDVDHSYDWSKYIQLGFDAAFTDLFGAQLLLDHDGHQQGTVDEATLSLETDSWSISVGREYLPFGQYYSNFVTDPVVIFGETRADGALTLSYSINDLFQVSAFVFDGDVKQQGHGNTFDWGGGAEYSSNDDNIVIGLSYLSDLSESGASLLKDFNNIYQKQVSGLNVYALLDMDSFEVTAELVRAMHAFTELDREENAPWAYNVELAHYFDPSFQVALRIETSHKLADEPQRQYGISASWRIVNHISAAMDYLFGKFKNDFVFDNNDNPVKSRNLVAAELSIEF